MHHIFVNENSVDLENDIIVISKNNDSENFNHLTKSLRISKGEQVLCSIIPFKHSFDYLCEVKNVSDYDLTLHISEESNAKELPVNINLYQGISKADKLEFIIEKAVELGVYSLTPFASSYCVAKIDDKKSDKKIERFNKIAKSAAEQSKRHIIPLVKNPITFSELIELIKNDKSKSTYNILFFENANGISKTNELLSIMKQSMKNGEKVVLNVIIGSEGGFSAEEIEKARMANISILSLGDRILRTETAAVTALSILMYEFTK